MLNGGRPRQILHVEPGSDRAGMLEGQLAVPDDQLGVPDDHLEMGQCYVTEGGDMQYSAPSRSPRRRGARSVARRVLPIVLAPLVVVATVAVGFVLWSRLHGERTPVNPLPLSCSLAASGWAALLSSCASHHHLRLGPLLTVPCHDFPAFRAHVRENCSTSGTLSLGADAQVACADILAFWTEMRTDCPNELGTINVNIWDANSTDFTAFWT